MIKLIFIVLMLLQPTSPAWAINFFRCKTTKDCTKAYFGCGRYGSVHRRYKELYEAKAHKSDTVSFCIAPTEKDKKIRVEGAPLCAKRNCRLVLKEKKDKSA